MQVYVYKLYMGRQSQRVRLGEVKCKEVHVSCLRFNAIHGSAVHVPIHVGCYDQT